MRAFILVGPMGLGISRVAKTDAEPYVIAGWRVDPASLSISREKQIIKLEPKVMSVLDYLAARPGTVITRRELEDSVWAGTIVGYDSLSNTIIKLRKAFGDKARSPLIIETITKSGYRLIAEVRAISGDSKKRTYGRPSEIAGHAAIGSEADSEHQFVRRQAVKNPDKTASAYNLGSPASETIIVLDSAPGPALPDKPSIAVLPFDNMSGDEEQEYFSDGISEDITTDLCKISGLLVIARNSAFAYKGRAVKVADISRELGVRYILEGSVRKIDLRVRINAQLIEGTTGGHVWAERYDRELNDIFSVQDEVTRAIVTAIAPALGSMEQPRPGQRETSDLEAYDYFLKGREQALLDTPEGTAQARVLLGRAIELEPSFSSAFSYLARCYALDTINNWGDPAQRSMETALDLGRKAAVLDANNPHAHFTIGTAALWLKMHDLALREINTALTIDPNFAEGYGALSMIQIYSGEPAKALESLRTTMRLDPHYRDIYLYLLAQAYFHLNQYNSAVEALRRRLIRKPESDISLVLLAACYGHLGKLEQSHAEWHKALAINPGYSLEQKRLVLPYRNPADFDHFANGLHKAGLVESNK